jgi:hypothetical protein
MKDGGQEPDSYYLFGYVQSQAVTALLEKAVELGDLSKDGIMKANEQLGTVEFGGLLGDYKYGPAAERNAGDDDLQAERQEALRARGAEGQFHVRRGGDVRVRGVRGLMARGGASPSAVPRHH